ncbi:hypothetical protein ACWOCB_04000 [Gemella haemolysans]|uniref:Uncharacterized protein n=1 Tax=Gemella haemolysans ATCC 10379 TaxID=546270 RepID=C5NVM0_9BACL|nr:hypothetical protein [Gemella haemolysans]EER68734.1 hypothetical protein GEMHA0001_0934 [Gemella haemolysans ATCC 10379]KAA8708344.1 hypothetical protein F4V11_03700 [Gemella haemolysans]UBH82359.1 hypothetical protein LA340_08590 [Gemella haemolysans]VEI39406.1 Uncharacterised protein [Gemella haemolysans]
MKIALIIILAIAIFMFFSTRNGKSKEEWAEKQKVSKEKFNELVKDSNREEVLSVVDATKGDIHNVKMIRDRYTDLVLYDAKALWEAVKEEASNRRALEVKELISSKYSDIKAVVNPDVGDIANIKIIRERFDLDIVQAKELWESIKDEVKQ